MPLQRNAGIVDSDSIEMTGKDHFTYKPARTPQFSDLNLEKGISIGVGIK